MEHKLQKDFWVQFRSYYREGGDDFRYKAWSADVKKVIVALNFPPDYDTTGVYVNKEIYAFAFMQRKGYVRQGFNATQFTDVVNALVFKSIKEGGETGRGVWHYD